MNRSQGRQLLLMELDDAKRVISNTSPADRKIGCKIITMESLILAQDER